MEIPKTSTDALKERLQEWGGLYGRKIGDEAMEVWIRLFAKYPLLLLAKALDQVTRKCERMPTPGNVTRAIEMALESEPWLSPHYKPNPKAMPGKDKEGVPCVYWEDEPMVPAYAAEDCKDGRAFLELMKKFKERTRAK
jgi:hypothetical protein